MEKIISFLFLIPSSMLSTVSALGAQNIGAGKPARAVATLRGAIAAGFGLAIAIVIQWIAEPVVGLFTPDPAVIATGGPYLRGYFCACGKSGLSFMHNVISIVAVRVPGAYLASRWFLQTLLPMGLASAAGSLLSVLICLIAFAALTRRAHTSLKGSA